MNISWQDYKTWLGDQWLGDSPDTPAPAVHLWNRDTRTIKAGEWYLPIVGESFDGHSFIANALASGAAGFLYQQSHRSVIDSKLIHTGFAVKDSLVAIQRIATGWRGCLPNTCILALTGSVGKTSVKELLRLILQSKGPTVATYGSYNNELGVPLTLLSIAPSARYAILEMGARKPRDIEFLASLAKPNVAAVINVGTAHLGIFGSRQKLFQTKTEMFRYSAANATLVTWGDDDSLMQAARQTGKAIVAFGSTKKADVWFADVACHADGSSSFILGTKDQTQKVQLDVTHEAYPVNVCAAAAMAMAAGVSLTDVTAALKGFNGLPGRYQVHRRGSQIIVDDAYNANPESMRAGLLSLAHSFAQKSLTLVLGDMLELGDSSAEEHVTLGEFAGTKLSPKTAWCIGAEAQHLAMGIKKTSPSSVIKTFPDVESARQYRLTHALCEDVVYLKGSNGIRLSLLLADLLETQ